MSKKDRGQSGLALLSILVIGATSMMFLLALASIVTSAVRSSASNKWVESVRNAAEIGMDYAVDRFNREPPPCSLDPSDETPKITELPANLLTSSQVDGITPNSGAPTVKVSIKVRRLGLSDWLKLQNETVASSIYSPQLDPNRSSGTTDWSSPNSVAVSNLAPATGGGFRVIESTATNGVVSRTVRVILKARFDDQPDGEKPLESGGSTPTSQSYFARPLFGNSSLSIEGLDPANPITVQGLNSAEELTKLINPGPSEYRTYNLNVSTNRLANLNSNVLLKGDVTINSLGSGTNDVLSSDGIIDGRVLSQGKTASNVQGFDDPDTLGTVRARADDTTTKYTSDDAIIRRGANLTPITTPSGSQAGVAPYEVPTSAANLASLGSYSESGKSPTADGDSTFQTNSLNTAGVPDSKPVVFDNSNPVKPVKIFVEPGGLDSTAVDINTNRISLTNPSNPSSSFQIWYQGSKPLNINMAGAFKGLIYAPNARVQLNGAGDFRGALVGKDVAIKLSSGSVKIDTDLANPNANGSGGGSTVATGPSYLTRPDGTLIKGWQPITWQEFSH